jgi:O-antigen ligase
LSVIHTGLRRYLPIAVACILAFLLLWASIGGRTVGRRLVSYHSSLEGRQELWALAASVAQRHPVIGIGRGNWETVTGRGVLPHNTFLSVFVDTGMIGLALFLAPIAVWLWRGLRQDAARPWAIAAMAGLVGGIAVSLDNFRFFWLALGALVGRLSVCSASQTTPSPDAGLTRAGARMHSASEDMRRPTGERPRMRWAAPCRRPW